MKDTSIPDYENRIQLKNGCYIHYNYDLSHSGAHIYIRGKFLPKTKTEIRKELRAERDVASITFI